LPPSRFRLRHRRSHQSCYRHSLVCGSPPSLPPSLVCGRHPHHLSY
jgi:hypothetical protein